MRCRENCYQLCNSHAIPSGLTRDAHLKFYYLNARIPTATRTWHCNEHHFKSRVRHTSCQSERRHENSIIARQVLHKIPRCPYQFDKIMCAATPKPTTRTLIATYKFLFGLLSTLSELRVLLFMKMPSALNACFLRESYHVSSTLACQVPDLRGHTRQRGFSCAYVP